jgi:hypothetical protein
MPETPEISPNVPPVSGLDVIAALLAEQITSSHSAASRCFAVAADEEDFGPAQRGDALRVASRLMHACAASANAIRRIKGGEFHHTISVEHVDHAAEKASRRARAKAEAKERAENPSVGELMTRMMEADIAKDLRDMHDRLSRRVAQSAERSDP